MLPVSYYKHTGYASPEYAQAFSGSGLPLHLKNANGWLLKRAIADGSYYDAMGCYPLFSCSDWRLLGEDLNSLYGDIISLFLVTDPFGNWDEALLSTIFTTICNPYKQHYVADLSIPATAFVTPHHQRNARKALSRLSVETVVSPDEECLNAWCKLYATLVTKHGINGLTCFSKGIFSMMMSVPGLMIFRARSDESTIGMLLWYVQGEVAYYHLGAYSEQGYKLKASFALFDAAIKYFSQNGVRWLNLGAGAGLSGSGDDGLSRFKEGWSTGTKPVFFCGQIFNHSAYDQLVAVKHPEAVNYFPAYRAGEFC